jgi:1,4-dihydroxy-2-naphthoate octaprenyltransferase
MSDPVASYSPEAIIETAQSASVACVSSFAGTNIRNRMMHFAIGSDFTFYLASMKADPKIRQLLSRSDISLLIHIPGPHFAEDREIEVTGTAAVLKEDTRIQEALELLKPRSPVVGTMVQSGNVRLLRFIAVRPQTVKYRYVKDILQGHAPQIIRFESNALPETDWDRFRRKVKAWIVESRYPFLSVSVIPVLLGAAIAWKTETVFNAVPLLLCLIGIVCLHLGTNIINDYFDHVTGNDEANIDFVRPFSGGSRMIQLGILTPLEVLMGAVVLILAGVGIGIYLTFLVGLPVLWLGLIGVLSGILYSAPKFSLVSKGIGEVLVGLNFGVLVANGSYFVQTGRFSWETFWASLPLGLLVGAILWINEFPDYKADRSTNKKTLVVRMGTKRSAIVYTLFLVPAFACIMVSAQLNWISPLLLTGLAALPFAGLSGWYALRFNDHPFDIAPGNGYAIIAFNIMGLLFLLSYLSFSFSLWVIVPMSLAAVAYVYWLYSDLRSNQRAFFQLREIG